VCRKPLQSEADESLIAVDNAELLTCYVHNVLCMTIQWDGNGESYKVADLQWRT